MGVCSMPTSSWGNKRPATLNGFVSAWCKIAKTRSTNISRSSRTKERHEGGLMVPQTRNWHCLYYEIVKDDECTTMFQKTLFRLNSFKGKQLLKVLARVTVGNMFNRLFNNRMYIVYKLINMKGVGNTRRSELK